MLAGIFCKKEKECDGPMYRSELELHSVLASGRRFPVSVPVSIGFGGAERIVCKAWSTELLRRCTVTSSCRSRASISQCASGLRDDLAELQCSGVMNLVELGSHAIDTRPGGRRQLPRVVTAPWPWLAGVAFRKLPGAS